MITFLGVFFKSLDIDDKKVGPQLKRYQECLMRKKTDIFHFSRKRRGKFDQRIIFLGSKSKYDLNKNKLRKKALNSSIISP